MTPGSIIAVGDALLRLNRPVPCDGSRWYADEWDIDWEDPTRGHWACTDRIVEPCDCADPSMLLRSLSARPERIAP